MDAAFEQFWSAFPRKVGKGAARKAFAHAITLTTLDAMLAALRWQVTQPQWIRDGGDYIPHPATWLNQERWEDEPMEQPQVQGKTARTLAAVTSWARKEA